MFAAQNAQKISRYLHLDLEIKPSKFVMNNVEIVLTNMLKNIEKIILK